MEDMEITSVGNAGLYVHSGGCRLLVDGLYAMGGHPFGPQSAAMVAQLLGGAPPFAGAAGLVFTHLHADHFDAGNTARYLAAHPRARAYLPAAGQPQDVAAIEQLRQTGADLTLWPAALGTTHTGHLGNAMLTAFGSPHMGAQYAAVPHLCVLLRTGGHAVLFTGDADCNDAAFAPLRDKLPLTAAVVNPLFLQNRHSVPLLESWGVQTVVVNHIPEEAHDTMGLRRMVQHAQRRCEGAPFALRPLLQNGQTVRLQTAGSL